MFDPPSSAQLEHQDHARCRIETAVMTIIERTIVSCLCTTLLTLSTAASAGTEPDRSAVRSAAGLQMLEEIQTVITELAESAKPAVVNLFPLSGPGRPRELPQER